MTDLSAVLDEGVVDNRPRHRRLSPLMLVGLIAALVLLAIAFLAVGGFFGENPRQSEPLTTLAATTTIAPATTVTPPTAAAPAATTISSTTTTTSSTTTTTSSTTTTTTLAAPFIEPIGDGFDVEQLRLSYYGIGDLDFGDPAGDVLGVLAASLGQPDSATGFFISDGEFGTCPGDTVREIGWGPLRILIRHITGAADTFIGFGLDGRSGWMDHRAAGLQTVSGLGLGTPLTELDTMFLHVYDVTLGRDAEGTIFELLDDDTVVLWGPVGDGLVLGIYSVPDCGE